MICDYCRENFCERCIGCGGLLCQHCRFEAAECEDCQEDSLAGHNHPRGSTN